ncbi:hypothetical protein E5161_14730 [Cohnella pontilimi]|uniref:50S ribosomal protein L33 n=1 Tax=Cohnella pontilimi TaxID=2564100 RepID=A0A4U0F916_9BACL|nr:hypothetical protein [Cohnella pontilimi]TJY40968.1 hypothetical protein E5161_14730 [Cohnella pontilimi]
MSYVSRAEVEKMVGQNIIALRKDGTVVQGKLVRVNGEELEIKPLDGSKAQTKAILPLALFDILAISTLPFAGFGGFGFGFPGFFW